MVKDKRIFQDEIFIVNRIAKEIKTTFGSDYNVVTASYNYSNRCISSHYVDERYIDISNANITSDLNEISEFLYRKKIQEFVRKFGKKYSYISCEELSLYELANIYNKFPKNKTNLIDGKIFSVHENGNRTIKYISIHAINNVECVNWPCVCLTFVFSGEEPGKEVYILDQDTGLGGEVFGSRTKEKIIQDINKGKKKEKEITSFKEPLFDDYFKLLFYGNKKFNTSDFVIAETNIFFSGFGLILPFYDATVKGQSCGTCKGIMLITDLDIEEGTRKFDAENDVETFVVKNDKLLLQYLSNLSKSIIESDKHIATKLTFEHYDPLKDMLSKITLFQDWDNVIVLSGEKPDKRYCFEREDNLSDAWPYELRWQSCSNSIGNMTRINQPCGCKYINKEEIATILTELSDKDATSICIENRYYYCVRLESILDSRVLPSYSGLASQWNEYNGITLCFKFPQGTIFPLKADGEYDVKGLGKYYFEQLIPIFDNFLSTRNTLYHGIKSATNAIISRNHSHHIGSHVTPRTSIKIIRDRIKNIYSEPPFEAIEEIDAVHDLKLRMDNYVQQKADFMAEIATTSLYTTVSKPLFSVVLSRFIQNSLLMDNIGANESVNYQKIKGKWENRLRIRLMHNGKPITVHYKRDTNDTEGFTNESIPYNRYESIVFSSLKKSENGSPNNKFEDISIAWPGPLGEFALYCFLENFIRNAIKHNTDKLNKKKSGGGLAHQCLDVFINIKDHKQDDKKDEFYSIEIWDNITDPNAEVATITNPVTKSEAKQTLLTMLKNKIHPRRLIIGYDGSLKKGAWGIAEMRIMANLLSGSDDFTRMDKLSVSAEEEKGEGEGEIIERLVFRFDCMKPKEILIITDTDIPLDLKHAGIYHYKDFEAFGKKQQKSGSIAKFNIAILDKKAGDDRKGYELSLPFRVLAQDCDDRGLVNVNEDFIQIISQECKEEDIRNRVWNEWGKRFMPKDGWGGYSLLLFLGQDENESPIQDWLKLQENVSPKTLPTLTIATKENGSNETEIFPLPCENDYTYIVFDRHLHGCYDVLKAKKNIYFIEQLEANSADFVPLMSTEPSDMLWCKLVESGCLKVLLIDERFAEAAGKAMTPDKVYNSSCSSALYVYKNRTRLEVARMANIFIATHLKLEEEDAKPIHHSVMELDAENHIVVELSRKKNKNDQLTLTIQGQNNFSLDALIIHQGVAETLLRKTICHDGNERNFKDAFKQFLDELKKQVPYILVDSGRGIPSDLPENVKFMPFSLLESFVMQGTISKYSLTEIIMSIAKNTDNVGRT